MLRIEYIELPKVVQMEQTRDLEIYDFQKPYEWD
jgi:hypothetical protein